MIVVMPAYNAAGTLERIYNDIPHELVAEVIVVDDCSDDDTVAIARRLPVTLIRHDRNVGYGGTQKTCYAAACERGASAVVMLHADYQYDGRMIGPAVHILNRTMGAFAGWYAHRARLVDLPRYRPRGGERARPSSQS